MCIRDRSSCGNQARGLWRSTPDFRPVVVRMQNLTLPTRAPRLPFVSRISATCVSVKALMRRFMAEVMGATIRGMVGMVGFLPCTGLLVRWEPDCRHDHQRGRPAD